jgi:hypothetical protein
MNVVTRRPERLRNPGGKAEGSSMLEGKTVAVASFRRTTRSSLAPRPLAGIPALIDHIYVVVGASRDSTVNRARAAAAKDPVSS